jgi:hypothetical protein
MLSLGRMNMNKKVFVLANLMFFSGVIIFSQNNNTYVDRSSQTYNDLISITEKDFQAEYYNTESAREVFTKASDLYIRGEYKQAIDYYIRACNAATFVLAYYHLGWCLMDVKEYELAKVAYKKAINIFEDHLDYPNYWDYFADDFFTLDNNGIKRELYFSYYNIACIESLQNNLNSAYEYLREALYHGYPYINHIRQDEDLRNLFRDRSRLQSIEAIYNAGSKNTLMGKRFNMNISSGGFVQLIHFQNEKRLQDVVYHQDGRNSDIANYEIKNYMVFSKIFSSSWRYGEGRFKYVRQFEGLDHSGKNFTELSAKEMAEYDKIYGQYYR